MSDPKEQDGPEGTLSITAAKAFLTTRICNKMVRKTIAQRPPDSERKVSAENSFWTTQRNGEVKLRMDKNSEDEPPVTVPDMIMSAATKYSHYLAIGCKYKKSWQLLTYIEYYEACRRAAKAFLKVGLERFHGVGIMGSNSTEWVIANIGAIMAGGISVGILCTNSPKACQVIAETSEMDIFVVDNERQLQKVNQIQGYLKHLKAIIQYREDIQEVQPNLYSWKGFLDLADGISDEKLDQIIDSQKPNQCCALVYKQGISGPPKATMLSHDNSLEYKCPPNGQEVLVSYLPLCFAGTQILDVWVAISVAGTVYFPSPEAGKWNGPARAPGTLTFDPARKFLGLNHCQQFLNLGLGLPRNTLDFFLSLNIPIFDMYGLTECSGLHALSSHQAFRQLSCGKALPSALTKVEKENRENVGNLCVWGRHIFMGYLNDKVNTAKRVDSQGWLHTNDLGFLDVDNFVYILGNNDDLITLSSGEVINPSPIEERVMIRIPIVRYAMLVGQNAPYLCALLTLKCQINPETGEARSALTSEAVACCRKLRSQSTWLTDVLYDRDPLVTEFISQGIQEVNAEAPSEAAKIIKWVILDNDFSVGGGELGPMTKLNRTAVAKIYQEDIQKFYERSPSS
ncbi:long-chain-fatty-acid--CoA ligase ACSBG2-like protein [Cricetulus griseus]|nr:long-chain-fatty-acid--CoA ligase ACSBG2-like protein [Cricetulus griseus]